MSMENSNDTIGNRTRDLPTCSTVPQPTALPRAPISKKIPNLIINYGPLIDNIQVFSGETSPLCLMNSNIYIYKNIKYTL